MKEINIYLFGAYKDYDYSKVDLTKEHFIELTENKNDVEHFDIHLKNVAAIIRNIEIRNGSAFGDVDWINTPLGRVCMKLKEENIELEFNPIWLTNGELIKMTISPVYYNSVTHREESINELLDLQIQRYE